MTRDQPQFRNSSGISSEASTTCMPSASQTGQIGDQSSPPEAGACASRAEIARQASSSGIT